MPLTVRPILIIIQAIFKKILLGGKIPQIEFVPPAYRNPMTIYMWDNILYSRQVYSHAKTVKSIRLSNDELVIDKFFFCISIIHIEHEFSTSTRPSQVKKWFH